MAWYPVVGHFSFWVGLIISIIIYSIKRKWYPILFIISVALYIFTVGFIMDVFALSRDGILLMLVLSAAAMIGMGFYLSKKLPK